MTNFNKHHKYICGIRNSVPNISLYVRVHQAHNKKSTLSSQTHLIHLQDNRLHELSELHKICNVDVLQENIVGLDTLVKNMTLKKSRENFTTRQ